jgi:hypothetical protein
MTYIRPIRIEPAFDDHEQIRAMFERHAPYSALATYIPERLFAEETSDEAKRSVFPWFRGNWALGGKPLVEGVEFILHNKKFVEAAKVAFGTAFVNPEFVAVNLNAPSPAGFIHVDIPSFYGATRDSYPIPLLKAMGDSGLFEAWRVVRASTISWFYEGSGGSFDYWPEGLDGPMLSEQPPFGNVALLGDNDLMYHRIGATGNPNAELPRMSAAAKIQPDGEGNWTVLENGEVRAIYPSRAIRLSVLWKAEVRNGNSSIEHLTLDRIMEIFTADLRRRCVEFQAPSDPLADTAWIFPLKRIYVHPTAFARGWRAIRRAPG